MDHNVVDNGLVKPIALAMSQFMILFIKLHSSGFSRAHLGPSAEAIIWWPHGPCSGGGVGFGDFLFGFGDFLFGVGYARRMRRLVQLHHSQKGSKSSREPGF